MTLIGTGTQGEDCEKMTRRSVVGVCPRTHMDKRQIKTRDKESGGGGGGVTGAAPSAGLLYKQTSTG